MKIATNNINEHFRILSGNPTVNGLQHIARDNIRKKSRHTVVCRAAQETGAQHP